MTLLVPDASVRPAPFACSAVTENVRNVQWGVRLKDILSGEQEVKQAVSGQPG